MLTVLLLPDVAVPQCKNLACSVIQAVVVACLLLPCSTCNNAHEVLLGSCVGVLTTFQCCKSHVKFHSVLELASA